jgi:hypothetical protein
MPQRNIDPDFLTARPGPSVPPGPPVPAGPPDPGEPARRLVPPEEPSGEDQVLVEIAARLRAAYFRERHRFQRPDATGPSYGDGHTPHWDGGVTSTGRKVAPVWPKLAAHVVAHGCDPDQYIVAQFSNRRSGRAPGPAELLSPEAVFRYREFVGPGETARIRARLEAEARTFDQARFDLAKTAPHASETQVIRTILVDDGLRLSAMFRCLMAVAAGQPDLCLTFAAAAAVDYLPRRDAYEEVLGPRIPPAVRETASQSHSL